MSSGAVPAGVCQHLAGSTSQTCSSLSLFPSPLCQILTSPVIILHSLYLVPNFSISVTAPFLPVSLCSWWANPNCAHVGVQ